MKTFSAEVMWFLEGGRQQKELINLRIAGGDHGIRPASVYRDGASEYCQDRDDGPGNGIIDSRGGG